MREMSREERAYQRKKARKRRASRIYQIAAIFFVLTIFAAVIANLVKKDVSFSESENRILTEKPKWNLQDVASGEYMSQFESYAADQFILRDSWIQLKLQLDKLAGKKESNGVYLGKDGYLMEVLDEPNEEYEEKNLSAIGDFAQRHQDLNVSMTLVPNAAYILEEKMPKNAPVRDQEADLEKVRGAVGDKLNFVDVTEVLREHAGEEIYYKTDHHWTSLGAKYVFEEMADDLGITPVSDYKEYTVSDTFSGTLASKSGYHGQKDTIQVYDPQGVDNDYVVFYADTQEKTTSIYDRSCLKEKDQYTVFFGGNHTRIDIESPYEEDRCLLIFKDSYANSFVQFLTPYYRKIILIDPRYYYDNVEQLMASEGVTDVLFLYNLNTFLTDTSLADVLAEEAAADAKEAGDTGGSENADSSGASDELDAGRGTDESSAGGESTEENGNGEESAEEDSSEYDEESEETKSNDDSTESGDEEYSGGDSSIEDEESDSEETE